MNVNDSTHISHQTSSIVFSRKDAKNAKEFKFLDSITKNGDSLCDLGVLGEKIFLRDFVSSCENFISHE